MTSSPFAPDGTRSGRPELRFVFDARYVKSTYQDGISRFSIGLGNALAQLTPITLLISDSRQLREFPTVTSHIRAPGPESIREVFTARLINRTGGADIVFSPLQVLGGFHRNFALILTLHDLTYHTFRAPPDHLHWPTRALWRVYHLGYRFQRLNLNRADAIATVSRTSAAAIRDAGLVSRPLIILRDAPSKLAGTRQPQIDMPPRHLIYIGTLQRHKNVETLIEGMRELPGWTLHILSPAPKKRIAALRDQVPPHANVVFHEGVTDEGYADLLASGSVLVSASLSEGFCLPAVEALSAGVPCLLSDLPVMREVAGPGALYFDPEDPAMFAECVKRLDDLSVRTRLVRQGGHHIQEFTWEGSAKTLLDEARRIVTSGAPRTRHRSA